MSVFAVFLFLYTVSLIIIKWKFHILVRGSLNKKNHKQGKLFGHGVQTLINGINNMVALLMLIWFGFIILYINNAIGQVYGLYSIFKMVWLTSMILGLPSCLYKISEIKHLDDGISTNSESDEFYIWYFKVGVYNLIIYLGLGVYAKFSSVTYVIIFLSTMLLFIMGMGDLLQTKGINKYGEKRYKMEQTFRIFIDIPINIISAIFTKEGRNDFIKNLKNNLLSIKGGITKYITMNNR